MIGRQRPPTGSPIGFVSVDLLVDFVFDTQDHTGFTMEWSDGSLSVTSGSVCHPDLTVRGPARVVMYYVCGQLDSHHLFASAQISGDLGALSAFHGLCHHPSVRDYWATRLHLVEEEVLRLSER